RRVVEAAAVGAEALAVVAAGGEEVVARALEATDRAAARLARKDGGAVGRHRDGLARDAVRQVAGDDGGRRGALAVVAACRHPAVGARRGAGGGGAGAPGRAA